MMRRYQYDVIRTELPADDPEAQAFISVRLQRFKDQCQRTGKIYDWRWHWRIMASWIQEEVEEAVDEEKTG